MSIDRFMDWTTRRNVASLLLSAVLLAGPALAQENRTAPERSDFLGGISRWFDEQAAKFNSNFKDARSQVENFGREAGIAARSTATGAKDAADTVAKIPGTRTIRGHEKCATAPNGAPDCVAAATAICKGAGFQSGKSVDMTTSEICPAQVYLSRNSGATCHTETFVSRALCQ
jgi:hypothetical protein